MQLLKNQEYEYSWKDNQLTNCHSFLMKPLLSMLPPSIKADGSKLRVLDLGCGNGSLSNVIASQGYEVVGVEESLQGVEQADKNFSQCKFFQGSIYELPYEKLENSFDVVISVEVIEHLFYPKELVKAAKKCLKSDSSDTRLILTTPYHGYLKNIALAISGKMDWHFHVLWDGGHIKFFSVKSLSELLKQEGYTDISFRFAGRLPYLWKSMLCSCSPLS